MNKEQKAILILAEKIKILAANLEIEKEKEGKKNTEYLDIYNNLESEINKILN
jgi:hypothetical protein